MPRPEPTRIMALSLAMALHLALGLMLLLPPSSTPVPAADDALSVDIVPIARPPAPAPPPPPAAPRPQPQPEAPTPPAASTEAPAAPGPEREVERAWAFDPDAAGALIVYEGRPALDLPEPDQPAAEIPHYRDSTDPSRIAGLNGADAGGTVTFDVLVDEGGQPIALVVLHREGSQRALETAMAVIGQWRFMPASRDGFAVQAWLQVTLEF